MTVPLLDLKAQYATIRNEIEPAVKSVIEGQTFVLGPVVERFEREVGAYIGASHSIGCASGTDALILPLMALDLKPGDEVIVPSFTFFATAGAVHNAGGTPVFADVEADTFNISPDAVEKLITARTRAIVPVHLYGQMADMEALMSIADAHGIPVIEDAAQSIGSSQLYRGEWKQAGTIGWAGAFSFFPTKNLGAFGDGGLITTQDNTLAEKLLKIRVHGGRQMYHHEYVGTNSRLDALQAAVLSVKLHHLDEWAAGRRANAEAYDQALNGVQGIVTPKVRAGNISVYNQYTIRVRDRDRIKASLDGAGIGSAIYYPVPLHLQECFGFLGGKRGDHPNAERACDEVLSLPVYPELTSDQRAAVVSAVTAASMN